MGITVNDSLNIGGLKSCKVVAGKNGLGRIIDHITVMEVPDIINWLKGNELLITSLYPIKDDVQAINRLVQQLHDKGCAALAIKTNRFFSQIPAFILTEGDRLNFPIIEIEKEITYLDIMTPIMNTILDQSSFERNNLTEFLKWITEMALNGKGIGSIVNSVEKITENLITVESDILVWEKEVLKVITPLDKEQVLELIKSKNPVRMKRKLNDEELPCIVVPIFLNEQLYGAITCWQTVRSIKEMDIVILERVIPLIALEILKIKTRLDIEEKYKSELLFDIFMGYRLSEQKNHLQEKAKNYGWDFTSYYQVFVFNIDHFEEMVDRYGRDEILIQEFKGKVFRSIERTILESRLQSPIVGMRSDCVVVLLPMEEQALQGNEANRSAVNYIAGIQEKLRKRLPNITFTIGIGRMHRNIEGIHLGYQEAIKAIHLGRRVKGRDSIIHFDDLGIYRILAQFDNPAELSAILAQTLGKLIEYDTNHQTDLTDTLTQYFQSNCGLSETAEKLYIHVNTLKYRLQKVEQITGLKIGNAEDRLQLHLGLKILHILQIGKNGNSNRL